MTLYKPFSQQNHIFRISSSSSRPYLDIGHRIETEDFLSHQSIFCNLKINWNIKMASKLSFMETQSKSLLKPERISLKI